MGSDVVLGEVVPRIAASPHGWGLRLHNFNGELENEKSDIY